MLTLLNLLKDGRFHSGQALGVALGISRSAVWKRLQLLEAELSLPIHKVRGRGYQLASPLSLLDNAQLAACTPGLDWPFLLSETLDSTNAEALRIMQAGRPAPFIVLAERQTAGRGRRGRKWVSPFAENLYYSLVLRVEGGMGQLEGLSLVVGLAVLKALRERGVAKAGLKWPNDILLGKQKLAGILLELAGDPADVCHVVIGIGINVNMLATGEVDQAWTSMRLQLGEMVDRNALAGDLTRHLNHYLGRHRVEGFLGLQEEWQDNHLWQGQAVSLVAGSYQVDGTVLGVDKQGALRLQVGNEERLFNGGELSLRLRHDS